MPVEIERKFLVVGAAWRASVARSQRMEQGYLTRAVTGCSVRVRVAGADAWLNVKAAVPGIERLEYEYAIPVEHAREMLEQFCPARVEKIRHDVPWEGRVFEVDEFLGANTGLIVAELELDRADATFAKPGWLGRDVSAIARYYNLHLLDHPYSRWSVAERAGG